MRSWHRADGAIVPHHRMMAEMAGHRFVLLGERHDRADMHRWQLHVAAGIAAHRPVALGFEMFPARLNPVLDAWVAGDLAEADFLDQADWAGVWGFPAELYLPIFRACRELGWPMAGLNVPRSLVRRVGAEGWDAIPEAERAGLTPAVPSSEAYRRFIFELTGGARSDREARGPMDPVFDRFVRAQEVWDRAFAQNLDLMAKAHPEATIVGIIGMGHLQFGGGVPWQLAALGQRDVQVLLPQAAPGQPVDPGSCDGWMVLPPQAGPAA